MKNLTLIIPTYNMENYLHKCLSSLIVNKGLDNLEVLVINDGSKDSSLSIAREYETKFPNTFKVIDKENGNYGSCINRGLKEATGKYIKILDADDFFDINCFEYYLEKISDTNCDLVVNDFVRVYTDDTIIEDRNYKLTPETTLYFNKICQRGNFFKQIMMHAVAYKKEIFTRINYHQTEGISYTDNQWVFAPMSQVETVYYIHKPLYHYLVGRPGQTVDPTINLKRFNQEIKVIHDMILQRKELTYSHKEVKEEMDNVIKGKLVWAYLKSLFPARKYVSDQQLKEFDCFLKKETPELHQFLHGVNYSEKCKIKVVKYWREHHYHLPLYYVYYCRIMQHIKGA